MQSKWAEVEKEQTEFVNALTDELLVRVLPFRATQQRCHRHSGRPYRQSECAGTHLTLMKSGYIKGTIRSDVRLLLVSNDVRRHRLISISYIGQILCHGRGRGFESRRPRHSFQKSFLDFFETNEGAKGCILAPFLHPFRGTEPRLACGCHDFEHIYMTALGLVSEAKTSASTAACAACFAGEIA